MFLKFTVFLDVLLNLCSNSISHLEIKFLKTGFKFPCISRLLALTVKIPNLKTKSEINVLARKNIQSGTRLDKITT